MIFAGKVSVKSLDRWDVTSTGCSALIVKDYWCRLLGALDSNYSTPGVLLLLLLRYSAPTREAKESKKKEVVKRREEKRKSE